MAGSQICCWNNCPFRIKPCGGNLEEDFLESLPAGVRQQTSNVFKQEELRLKLPSKTDDFIEQDRTVARETQAFARRRKVLARKASGNNVYLA